MTWRNQQALASLKVAFAALLPVTTGSFLEVQFQSFADWSAVIHGGPHRKTMLKNRVYVCKRTDEFLTIP